MSREEVLFGDYLDILRDPKRSGSYYLTTQYDSEDEDPDADLLDEPAEAEAGSRKRKRAAEEDEDDDEDGASATNISLTPDAEELDTVLPSPTHALINDFPAQPNLMGGLVLQQCNLWLGAAAGGKSSGLHHDFHDNLYVLLSGRKRFLLFPPSAHEYLHVRGELDVIHPNGLIVYKDPEDDSDADGLEGDDSTEEDDDDESNDLSFNPARLQRQLARMIDVSEPEIRADGLPLVQAAAWRLRARLRLVRSLEDAAARSAGEGGKSKKARKGKQKMSEEMERAIAHYEQAKSSYRKMLAREQGDDWELSEYGDDDDEVDDHQEEDFDINSASSSDDDAAGSWSVRSGSPGAGLDAAEESDDDNALFVKRAPRGQPGSSSKIQLETAVDDDDLSDIEPDELAGLLEDATDPVHLLQVAAGQAQDGQLAASSESSEEDDDDDDVEEEELAALLEEAAAGQDEEEEDSDEDAEEDELAALLEKEAAGQLEGSEEEEESEEDGGLLSKAQLQELQKRFGKPGSKADKAELVGGYGSSDDGESSEDADFEDEDESEMARLFAGEIHSPDEIRKIMKLAYGEDIFEQLSDQDLVELLYTMPMTWASKSDAGFVKEDLAMKLRLAWRTLREYDTGIAADEEEDEEDSVDGTDSEENWRLFDDLEQGRLMLTDAGSEDSDDNDDLEEEDNSQPLFGDGDSVSSAAFGDLEDGEAALARLLAEAEGGPSPDEPADKDEPRSFSRIRPADLHEYFGIDAKSKKSKKEAKRAKRLHKPSKFESEEDTPLPLEGCPQPIEVRLEAGQMLYLPASWFHEVTSFSGPAVGASGKKSAEDAQFHMALNYWFHPPDAITTKKRKVKRSRAAGAEASTASSAHASPERPNNGGEIGSIERPYVDAEVWDEIAIAVQDQIEKAKKVADAHVQQAESASKKTKTNGSAKKRKGKAERDSKRRKL